MGSGIELRPPYDFKNLWVIQIVLVPKSQNGKKSELGPSVNQPLSHDHKIEPTFKCTISLWYIYLIAETNSALLGPKVTLKFYTKLNVFAFFVVCHVTRC